MYVCMYGCVYVYLYVVKYSLGTHYITCAVATNISDCALWSYATMNTGHAKPAPCLYKCMKRFRCMLRLSAFLQIQDTNETSFLL